jgi:hypothetical protein
MLRDNQLESGNVMEDKTRNGMFFILIRDPRLRLRDSMKNLAYTSTDHSILSLSYQ